MWVFCFVFFSQNNETATRQMHLSSLYETLENYSIIFIVGWIFLKNKLYLNCWVIFISYPQFDCIILLFTERLNLSTTAPTTIIFLSLALSTFCLCLCIYFILCDAYRILYFMCLYLEKWCKMNNDNNVNSSLSKQVQVARHLQQ